MTIPDPVMRYLMSQIEIDPLSVALPRLVESAEQLEAQIAASTHSRDLAHLILGLQPLFRATAMLLVDIHTKKVDFGPFDGAIKQYLEAVMGVESAINHGAHSRMQAVHQPDSGNAHETGE